MPVVKIEMWDGRTNEEKKKLIKNVTNAVCDSIGCPLESVQIILNEVNKNNWGIKGEQASNL